MEATAEQKTRLQRVLFAEGLRLRDGKIGTRCNLRGIHAVTSERGRQISVGVPNGSRTAWTDGQTAKNPVDSVARGLTGTNDSMASRLAAGAPENRRRFTIHGFS